MYVETPAVIKRIGIVATRVAGTDGVSLETRKWTEVLNGMGFECYFITGESDQPADRTVLIDEAHFNHSAIRAINRRAFGTEQRDESLTDDILYLTREIRAKLKTAIRRLGLDLLIAENSLTIPMNIPLGLAIVHAVQELNIPCNRTPPRLSLGARTLPRQRSR